MAVSDPCLGELVKMFYLVLARVLRSVKILLQLPCVSRFDPAAHACMLYAVYI